MAIDFGSFINGMRMSNQDIMDRQRFEQNQKYVQSQMDTMDLARQAEQQRMKMTDMQMQRLPIEYGQQDYKFYSENELPEQAAAFATRDPAPTAANDVLDSPQFQAAREKAGLSPITQRVLPEAADDGTPLGTFKVYDTKTGKALSTGLNKIAATEASARLLHGTWFGDDIYMAGLRSRMGYGQNTAEAGVLRSQLSSAQKMYDDAVTTYNNPMNAADPAARAAAKAAMEKAQQDIFEIRQQMSDTPMMFDKRTGAYGAPDPVAVSAGKKNAANKARSDEEADLAKPDVPKGDVSSENGITVITEKGTGKKWKLAPTGKFYYGDTSADRYIDPTRQARREALAKQPDAAPAGALRSAPGGKKPAAKPAAPAKGNGVTATPGGATVNGVNISF